MPAVPAATDKMIPVRASDVPPFAPVVARAVQPAFRAFASALFEAAAHDARPVADPTAPSALPPLTGVAATAPSPAPTDARAPLDLTQPRWPTAMVDRIEALRDRADSGDTRIRLVPDALGSIEVAVRQVGDTVHVHFTAAEAQTRSLLLDAQPQLARAAADRGMTLGDTSVGGGGAQADAQQRSPQGSPTQTQTPRPPRTTPAGAADAADPDTRIA
jgi:flagellar hook-length control protein FliK